MTALRQELQDTVLVATLDRPEVRNAVNMDIASRLEDAIDHLEGNPDLHVGVLCAEGPVFCAGGDLNIIANRAPLPYTDRGGFAGIVRRQRTKPWIVAVEGPALAGGFEIVLACDIVVASTSASFGIPEVQRGLFAGGGGAILLGARLATSAAMSMALTGDPITAERAHQLGIVSELVAPGMARPRALALARRIAANPAFAVGLSRQLVLTGATASAEGAWAANDAAGIEMLARPDLTAGPKAFLAGRTR